MKTFNKAFKVGTKVRLLGESEYREVAEIHETRKGVRIEGLMGWFQRGHIEQYTNRVQVTPLYTTYKEDQVAALFARESVNSCGGFEEHNNMSYLNAEDVSDAFGWELSRVGGVLSSLLAKGYITDTDESARGSHLNDFVANPSEYLKNEALKHLVTKEQ